MNVLAISQTWEKPSYLMYSRTERIEGTLSLQNLRLDGLNTGGGKPTGNGQEGRPCAGRRNE